jgi:predicted transcriptional regulator
VSRFIERFALVLSSAGFARMPARVFTGLLATDSGRLTATELAELLSVSPAAISGAVRYLEQVNLVVRERDRGTRRDHYRVRDDSWYEAALSRERLLTHWADALRDGADALGPATDAGVRLTESVAFFEFMREETPALLARWQTRRAALRGGDRGGQPDHSGPRVEGDQAPRHTSDHVRRTLQHRDRRL